MTYPEAIQFLYSLRLFGAKFGLENTFRLATLASNPQEQLRFIHVAGTNGKGSTCAMLESIYRAAGLRTGLFTSPHLVSFRERIQVNRQLIPEADVVRLVEELRENSRAGFLSAPGRQDVCPTFFEFVTVMALKFFAEQRCDLVIWETGLGGRLDATNIVTPLAGVITNIALDHQQWLGDTLEKIAFEKAGIIKPGIPVLTATDEPEALKVIESVAREQRAPLNIVAADVNQPHSSPRSAALLRAAATLPLPGEHQRTNAALALASVEILQRQIPVSKETIRSGLAKVHWPGRLQLIRRPNGQRIVLDGAHNVAAALALREALRPGAPVSNPARGVGFQRRAEAEVGTPITLILGVLQDKDWRHICEILAPLAERVFTVPVASERAANPDELAAACRAANPAAEVFACASLGDALKEFLADAGGAEGARAAPRPPIVVTGSLYLVGEALEILGRSPDAGGERELNEWGAVAPPVSASR